MRFKFFSLGLITLLIISSFGFNSVPVAKASVPTFETNPSLGIIAGASTGNLAKRIQEFVFKITMENLKRTALNTLTSQMITSVTGGDNPSIVGNWQNYYSQNYQLGSQSALDQVNPYLHPALGGGGQGYNPSSFSWNNYLGAWRDPGRNYYLGGIIANNESALGGYAAAEAAKNEAIAGGGFLSTKNSSGQITTPGSVARDVTSRALTSDIDYIVNAEDLTGFVSALGNSIFNKFVGQNTNGLLGLSGNILSGGGLGNTILGDLGNVLNINPTTGQILLNDGAGLSLLNQALDSISSSSGSNGLSLLNNSSFQNGTNNLGGSGGILGNSISDINLPEPKTTKEESLEEVQGAIFYLNDIKSAVSTIISDQKNQNNDFNNIDYSVVNNVLDKLNTISSSLDTDLKNSQNGTTADSSELRRFNFIEREILRDLYTANMTFTAGGNFDAHDVLPLHLNRNDLPTNRNLTNTRPVYDKDNSNSNPDNEGLNSYSPICTTCQFFNNNIQFNIGVGSGTGDSNYIGLNIPKRSSETQSVAMLFVSPSRLASYASNLNTIVDFYNSFIANKDNLLSDTEALSLVYDKAVKLASVREKTDSAILEIFKAKLYLADISALLEASTYQNVNLFNLLSFLQKNIDRLVVSKSELSDFNNLTSSNLEQKESSLKIILADVNSGGLTNLYTAGLDSGPASPRGKLPIVSLSNLQGSPINDLTKNINKALLPKPYSGSTIFGSSGFANTQYYWLSSNVNNYVSALNNLIAGDNGLIAKGVLSSINETEINFSTTAHEAEPSKSVSSQLKTSSLNSPNIVQFFRYFSDTEKFQYGLLSNDKNINSSSLKLGPSNIIVDQTYNSNILVKVTGNTTTSSNEGWVYREYNLNDINISNLNLTCSVDKGDLYGCKIKNIRVVSY